MRKRLGALTLAVVLVAAFAAPVFGSGGTVIFDNTPAASALQGHYASVSFNGTRTSQWGTQIAFAGTQRVLTTVVVTMSSWACQSGGWGGGCVTTPGATFSVPITFNVYAVGASNVVGSLLATDTQTFSIPYRPSSDPTNCPTAPAKFYYNGECWNGFDANISFDFSAQHVTLPDSVIFGIAFATTDTGLVAACSNTGPGCPYDSLNVVMYPSAGDGTTAVQPAVGTFPLPLAAYLNSTQASFYLDNGAGGINTFRLDSGTSWNVAATVGPYGGFQPAVQFTAVAAATTPTTKDQCKKSGWKTLQRADGTTFKNQGDCIQYFNTGK